MIGSKNSDQPTHSRLNAFEDWKHTDIERDMGQTPMFFFFFWGGVWGNPGLNGMMSMSTNHLYFLVYEYAWPPT